jgi:hypothetical protein
VDAQLRPDLAAVLHATPGLKALPASTPRRDRPCAQRAR